MGEKEDSEILNKQQKKKKKLTIAVGEKTSGRLD
jgi:hypothetical protein